MVFRRSFSFGYLPQFEDGSRSYTGQILHIDLAAQEFWVDQPADIFYRSFVGGRGFILHYLLTQTKPR